MRASTRFQPGTNLKAWLLTILKNVTSNHRRGQRRATVHTDPDAPEHIVARLPARELSPEQALLVRTLAPGLAVGARVAAQVPARRRVAARRRRVELRGDRRRGCGFRSARSCPAFRGDAACSTTDWWPTPRRCTTRGSSMNDCDAIDTLVTPYVDGELEGGRTRDCVGPPAHCTACRERVEAEVRRAPVGQVRGGGVSRCGPGTRVAAARVPPRPAGADRCLGPRS